MMKQLGFFFHIHTVNYGRRALSMETRVKVTNEMTWQTILSPRFHSTSLLSAPCHSLPRGEIFQRGVADTAYGARLAFEIACLATREMVHGVSSSQRISRVVIISGTNSPSWHELMRPNVTREAWRDSRRGLSMGKIELTISPERFQRGVRVERLTIRRWTAGRDRFSSRR